MSEETPGLDWSEGRLLPAFQPVQHLDIYDLRGAAPDRQLAATICAGIINRPRPSVYHIFNQHDQYWLQQLFSSLPQTCVSQTGDAAFYSLLDQYHSRILGLIIYDPALPDTLNVATTFAAQCDAIVVSPALAEILREKHRFPLFLDFRSFGWHNRAQAYSWAMHNLLDSSSARLLAGMRPTIMGSLRSFLVATRAFTCWLDTTSSRPAPEASGLSERALARQLFRAFQPGSLYLGWLPEEPSGVALLSHHAIPVLASDYCNNLEVWTALQPSSLPTVPPGEERSVPVPESDKIYVSFTLSDGDNLQYCQHHMLKLWQDDVRGTLPIGWTISPLLSQAAPALASYYQQTATPNDELLAGPDGAGYMFPTHWPQQHLSTFLQRTGELMQTMGLSTLMTLDSGLFARTGVPQLSKLSPSAMAFAREHHRRRFVHELAPYGVHGILTGVGFPFRAVGRWQMVRGIPVYNNLGLIQSVERAVSLLTSAAKTRTRPLFLNLYVEAWKLGPADLKRIVSQLGPQYHIVLPGTLLAMLPR